MTTVRQLSGMIEGKKSSKLVSEFDRVRGEFPTAFEGELGRSPLAAACVAVIRLIELEQTRTPLFTTLVRQIVEAQHSDGLFGDLPVSVLAARALFAVSSASPSALKALSAIALMQHDSGSFPRISVRRLPGDAQMTAFILVQLGHLESFAHAIRLEAALGYLAGQMPILSEHDRNLARLASRRTLHHVAGQARSIVGFS